MSALPKFTVKNFTDAQELKVYAHDYRNNGDIGQTLVTLRAGDGACSFQLSVTPAGARELADALHACANALETEVMEVGQ